MPEKASGRCLGSGMSGSGNWAAAYRKASGRHQASTFERLHQPRLDIAESIGVGDLMAESVPYVENVHREFAIGSNNSGRNAQSGFKQSARDVVQQTHAVGAFDLYHRRCNGSFIVEQYARSAPECRRALALGTLREKFTRLDFTRECAGDRLFQAIDASAIAEWPAGGVLNAEDIQGIAVGSCEDFRAGNRSIGDGHGAGEP